VLVVLALVRLRGYVCYAYLLCAPNRWVANDWSKAGDRYINGYIDVIRQQVKGGWTVHHQLEHVEKRKKHRWKDP
jgi:hypothetical protein